MVIRFIPAAMLVTLMASASTQAEQRQPAPVRLASTDAAVTEILIELGEASRLVAVDASSELPPGLALPRLGYHRSLAAEGLIALAPDLVIGSEHMGPPYVVDSLDRAGIEVIRLPSAASLEELRGNIARVAEALHNARGSVLLEQVDVAARRFNERALSGKSAAFLLRGEGGKLRLAGQGTGGGGFIRLIGADNVAGYTGYRSVTPEGLLQLAPDVLLLADTEGGNTDDLLAAYPLLRFSRAVKDGLAFTVDPSALVAGISLSALDEAGRVLDEAGREVARQ